MIEQDRHWIDRTRPLFPTSALLCQAKRFWSLGQTSFGLVAERRALVETFLSELLQRLARSCVGQPELWEVLLVIRSAVLLVQLQGPLKDDESAHQALHAVGEDHGVGMKLVDQRSQRQACCHDLYSCSRRLSLCWRVRLCLRAGECMTRSASIKGSAESRSEQRFMSEESRPAALIWNPAVSLAANELGTSTCTSSEIGAGCWDCRRFWRTATLGGNSPVSRRARSSLTPPATTAWRNPRNLAPLFDNLTNFWRQTGKRTWGVVVEWSFHGTEILVRIAVRWVIRWHRQSFYLLIIILTFLEPFCLLKGLWLLTEGQVAEVCEGINVICIVSIVWLATVIVHRLFQVLPNRLQKFQQRATCSRPRRGLWFVREKEWWHRFWFPGVNVVYHVVAPDLLKVDDAHDGRFR